MTLNFAKSHKMHHLTLLGFSLLILVQGGFGFTKQEIELDIINSLLNDYNRKIRPSGNNETKNGTTLVSVHTKVLDIQYIDDVEMEFALKIELVQKWNDPRLEFTAPGHEYLNMMEPSDIWLPQLIFPNIQAGRLHDLLAPNTNIRVYPSGDVLYTMRLSLTLACPMALELFPFDQQKCSFQTESFGYTTDDVLLKWRTENPALGISEIKLRRFKLERFSIEECEDTGDSSCIRGDFHLQRKILLYVIQVYIPTIFLVILAWASFWLPKTGTIVVGRLILALLTCLKMFILILYINFNSNFPRPSYTMALDVWTGLCLTFASVPIWEFVLVHVLARSEARKVEGLTVRTGRTLSDTIDILSRVLHPIAFILFAGVYMYSYNLGIYIN